MSSVVITEPGVYLVPEAEYHADPVAGGSMSSTVARKIMPPGYPALVEWARTHPKHSDAFDLGSAAHKLILGEGPQIAEIQADSWRTAAAKAARDQARADGLIPLLSQDVRAAEAMANAVRTHPLAGGLLHDIEAEHTLAWIDEETGVWCRAMVDAITADPLLVDVKTTQAVDDRALMKSIATYGYHQQAAWYLDGAQALGLEPEGFLFTFVTKEPPHLVRVVELDPAALQRGRDLNRRAMQIWATCRETGQWPGPSTEDITLLTLPRWAFTDSEDTP